MNTEKFIDLVNIINAQMPTNSVYAFQCMENIRLSLFWTEKYKTGLPRGLCDVLLNGCYGAAVEAVSLVSFGLVRPAVLSLRSHYELSLQYLFYMDHPVEWRSVQAFRSQPNLPRVVKRYLSENYPKFEDRFNILLKVKTRTNDDCYQLLSGVAHGTAINSISMATSPAELLAPEHVLKQTVGVFHDVGEHLSDIHVASFESNWFSLPDLTRADLEDSVREEEPDQGIEVLKNGVTTPRMDYVR